MADRVKEAYGSGSSDSESEEEEKHGRRALKSSVAAKKNSPKAAPRSPSSDKGKRARSRSRTSSERSNSAEPPRRDRRGERRQRSRERSRRDRSDTARRSDDARRERYRDYRQPYDDRRNRYDRLRRGWSRDRGRSPPRGDRGSGDYNAELRAYERVRRRDRDTEREDRKKSNERRSDERRTDEEKENRDDRKRKREETPQENDSAEKKTETGSNEDDMASFLAAKRAKADDSLTTRTGGAYIPPARLRMMQQDIKDKAGMQYQRISWEALKKSINGLINKVNVSNLVNIIRELFQENIVRARGVMARSIIQAQAASPTFTHVYAALVAIINTKFPQNGELILKRLILSFKKGFKRNDKAMCLSSLRFIAHLVNQQVAHEIIALEALTLLMENPTDDSVEVAVGFLKECGAKLTEVSPRGMNAIFERLRSILHEAQIDKRVQYMVEVMFATRKDGFKDFPAVLEELDLVEEDEQFTHMLTLDDVVNGEDVLNVFKFDPEYEQNEEKYKVLKKEILDESSDDESGSGSSGSDSDSDSDEQGEEGEEGEEQKQTIIDQTETNLVALRRTIYLTIQSSLDFEECCHKLMKLQVKPGQENEICAMIMDCCAQQRTYEKFFGLLAQRFCMIKKEYQEPFQALFLEQYEGCHRLETNKLRNVAKFFAHLLHSDAISWQVMMVIKLNEDDTTSSSRIFIKILFQELCEYMGLLKLNNRLKDETLQMFFEGLFPRDNPRNTRFAINFFTSIGLGGLTDELRAHLKNKTKTLMQQQAEQQQAEEDSSDSSSESSSSSSSSDTDDSSSEDEKTRRKKDRKSVKEKRIEQDIEEAINEQLRVSDKRSKPSYDQNFDSRDHRTHNERKRGDKRVPESKSVSSNEVTSTGGSHSKSKEHKSGDKSSVSEKSAKASDSSKDKNSRKESESKTKSSSAESDMCRPDSTCDSERKTDKDSKEDKKGSGSKSKQSVSSTESSLVDAVIEALGGADSTKPNQGRPGGKPPAVDMFSPQSPDSDGDGASGRSKSKALKQLEKKMREKIVSRVKSRSNTPPSAEEGEISS